MLQGKADVIQSLQQAILAKRVNFEGNDLTHGCADLLCRQIHHEAVALGVCHRLEELQLAGNAIGALPEAITGAFPSLRRLDLSREGFESTGKG
mgnify:CR=1 FL=1